MAGFIFYHPKLGEKKNKILEEAFKRADLNNDGKISVEEILFLFEEKGVSCTREEIQEIFSHADKDQSGKLNIREFVSSNKAVKMVKEAEGSASGSKSPGPKRKSSQQSGSAAAGTDKAQMAFKLYDKDKDGYITKAEMVKLSKNLTKEQVEKAFSKFDSDGDGRLSYEEFKKMMNK